MDSREASPSSLPAHLAPIRPAMTPSRPLPPTENKTFRARVIGTGLARYWKFILPLWLVSSAAAMTVIYFKVKASYEATSLVRLEPGMILFGGNNNAIDAASKYLSTQVNLFKSNEVLKNALEDPKVKPLAMVREAEHPIIELRNALWVSPRPNTFLVDITMRSDSLEEAEVLVNAVVDSFVTYQKSTNQQSAERNIDSLKKYKAELEQRIHNVENQITASVEGYGYPPGAPYTRKPNRPKNDDEKRGPGNAEDEDVSIKEEEYRGIVQNWLLAEMKLREAESYLEVLKKRSEEKQTYGMSGDMDVDRQEHHIKMSLESDPDLGAAQDRLAKAQKQIENTKRLARNTNDPSVLRATENLRIERQRYNDLWRAKHTAKQADLGRARPVDDLTDAEKIRNAEDNLHRANAARDAAYAMMESMKKEAQQHAKSMVKVDLRQSELNVLHDMVSTLEREIQQKTFDRDTMTEQRVMVIDKAKGSPVTDKRVRYMAMAPVLVLGLLVLGVVVLEVRSGRVTHPDDLSSRLRTEVFTVPPLPTLCAAALDDQRRLSRLEEFAQRMDHLRVALCGPSTHGGGRCVMITSAIGGEGKTTLAAQLAGRCANAGLSTLLIDADLRRPMLARLLEVPEQPGLAEVLTGDVEPETVLLVISNAGGFHLLPAGAAGPDPGRLFSGPSFGQLLQRLRDAFDVVIVDTPPVLPVPDALLLGRWADGAVLAARHDSSRSHLVERANQLLISAGIPLLGVVVNGARSGESAYGGYGSYASYRTVGYRSSSSAQA